MKRRLKTYLPKLLGKEARKQSLPATYDSLAALKCRIWYNEYGGYCLPESSLHRSASRRILSGEVYEPQTIEFMRNNCSAGDIVHAGTYFGDFLPGLSQACSPESRIWAFEPNPENFSCAQITVLINKLENVTLHNAGLGSAEDVLIMRTKDEDGRGLGGKSRIVSPKEFDPALDEEVQIVKIDDCIDCNRAVSIIQLDVEDHEKAALIGALETIHRCLPILILEVRRGSDLLDSEWFATNILNLGYARAGTLHNNTVFQCSG